MPAYCGVVTCDLPSAPRGSKNPLACREYFAEIDDTWPYVRVSPLYVVSLLPTIIAPLHSLQSGSINCALGLSLPQRHFSPTLPQSAPSRPPIDHYCGAETSENRAGCDSARLYCTLSSVSFFACETPRFPFGPPEPIIIITRTKFPAILSAAQEPRWLSRTGSRKLLGQMTRAVQQ